MQQKKQSNFTIIALFMMAMIVIAHAKTSSNKLLSDETNTIQVFQKSAPYVVNVHQLKTVINANFDIYNIQAGIASGFIWNQQGYLVTNYHVIRGANKIAVTLKNGKTVKAKMIGTAPKTDVAVLKLKHPKVLKQLDLHDRIPLADSSKLQVGQKVIAIGNPFGLDQTLTTGVISALGRSIPGIQGIEMQHLIQTDASINPGNSGGPLLNSSGQLIGMNTMIVSNTGSYAGIGFAVPSNTIQRIVSQIIKHGHVIQPGIGVQILNDQIARSLGVDGVLIGKVLPHTPAAKANLQGTWRDQSGQLHLGDIIIAVNGQRVHSYNDLYHILSKQQVGATITIKFLRRNKVNKVELKTINLSSA